MSWLPADRFGDSRGRHGAFASRIEAALEIGPCAWFDRQDAWRDPLPRAALSSWELLDA